MKPRQFLAGIVCGLLAAPLAAADAQFQWFRYQGSDPEQAVHTPAAGQYRNPILQGFYPDPSIVRVGQDFYLVNSTFSWFPGIPVFHSRDLVNWRQIGNAISRPTQLNLKGRQLSEGVFAPAISWHDGVFYIVNTCVGCGGNYLITARNPAGPWSDPIWLPGLEGAIDPSLFFDEDGSAWLVNNGLPLKERYEGHRAIWIQRFDPATLKLTGKRSVILDAGTQPAKNPAWIEGPHLLKRDGWYYLIAAEGGTGDRHSQVALRSRAIEGPYAVWEGNPILTQRDLPADRPFPVTSAGHADLVETARGQWWAVFLATRPYAGDLYNTGRETFLLPVTWTKDGWPVILPHGKPIPHVEKRPDLPPGPPPPLPTSGPFSVTDAFDSPALGLHWMSMRGPAGERLAGGALHLAPRAEGVGDIGTPSFVARRQQHRDMEASTLLSFAPGPGEAAGLAIVQRDEYWYALLVADAGGGKREARVLVRAGPNEPARGKQIAAVAVPEGDIRLRIVARGGKLDFDWAAREGGWNRLLADADGTLLSTQVAGGFVGAMIGPYAVKMEQK